MQPLEHQPVGHHFSHPHYHPHHNQHHQPHHNTHSHNHNHNHSSHHETNHNHNQPNHEHLNNNLNHNQTQQAQLAQTKLEHPQQDHANNCQQVIPNTHQQHPTSTATSVATVATAAAEPITTTATITTTTTNTNEQSTPILHQTDQPLETKFTNQAHLNHQLHQQPTQLTTSLAQHQQQQIHHHQHQVPSTHLQPLLPHQPKPRGRRKKIRTEPIRPICPQCEKQFSNQSALTKHKLTHSDERKFACQQCSKAFKRHDHLTGHMQTHSNRKPFNCTMQGCDKTYCDARSLRRHKENIHHIVTPKDHNNNNSINNTSATSTTVATATITATSINNDINNNHHHHLQLNNGNCANNTISCNGSGSSTTSSNSIVGSTSSSGSSGFSGSSANSFNSNATSTSSINSITAGSCNSDLAYHHSSRILPPPGHTTSVQCSLSSLHQRRVQRFHSDSSSRPLFDERPFVQPIDLNGRQQTADLPLNHHNNHNHHQHHHHNHNHHPQQHVSYSAGYVTNQAHSHFIFELEPPHVEAINQEFPDGHQVNSGEFLTPMLSSAASTSNLSNPTSSQYIPQQHVSYSAGYATNQNHSHFSFELEGHHQLNGVAPDFSDQANSSGFVTPTLSSASTSNLSNYHNHHNPPHHQHVSYSAGYATNNHTQSHFPFELDGALGTSSVSTSTGTNNDNSNNTANSLTQDFSDTNQINSTEFITPSSAPTSNLSSNHHSQHQQHEGFMIPVTRHPAPITHQFEGV